MSDPRDRERELEEAQDELVGIGRKLEVFGHEPGIDEAMTFAERMAQPCPTCGGKAKTWRDCWNCDGEGEVEATWDDTFGDDFHRCHHCGGRGGYWLCAKCAPPERDPYDDDEDFFDD